jgi:hypothetical protein
MWEPSRISDIVSRQTRENAKIQQASKLKKCPFQITFLLAPHFLFIMNRNNSSTLKNNYKLFGKKVPAMVEASKQSQLASFSSALFLNEEEELLLMTELLVHFEADTTSVRSLTCPVRYYGRLHKTLNMA